MKHSSDITIIGGGINGLLTAKELARSGCSVTILEKSQIGRESSWAGGGILLPLYPWRQAQAITDLVLDSLRRYPQLSRELLGATGIDPEWYDCGLLICKTPDIAEAVEWCRNSKIAYETPAADFFNELNTQPENPLWLPQIAQARNPRLLKSLKAFLLKAGVRFIENCEITGVRSQRNKIVTVHTGRGNIDTGRLVIAAGAWTNELLNNLFPGRPQTIDIRPVKGEMLLFAARPDTLPHMVLDGDRYLIPRRDGNILAGSTVDQQGFEKQPTEHAKTELHNFATRLLPALQEFEVVAHWAGLRPGTRDGVPYVGRHPEFENLYVNAGHFRNGLVMGPASAALLSALILNKTPAVDPAPYQIDHK